MRTGIEYLGGSSKDSLFPFRWILDMLS